MCSAAQLIPARPAAAPVAALVRRAQADSAAAASLRSRLAAGQDMRAGAQLLSERIARAARP